MLGIVGIGAHAGCADIEYMGVSSRRIGHALAEMRGASRSASRANRRLAIIQQMRGQHDAAGAAADNDDRDWRMIVIGVAPIMRAPRAACRAGLADSTFTGQPEGRPSRPEDVVVGRRRASRPGCGCRAPRRWPGGPRASDVGLGMSLRRSLRSADTGCGWRKGSAQAARRARARRGRP